MAGGLRIALGSSFAGPMCLLAMPASLPHPDLVEASVVVAQRTVEAGGMLRVADATRNRGDAKARPSTTGYSLSRERARGPVDARLGGRPVGSLAPHATSRGSATVRVPASTATGSYRVLACADTRDRVRESAERNNCRASTRLVTVIRSRGDRSPPAFAGLQRAVTCIPGPIGANRTSRYHLSWDAATDNVTPSSEIVYDIYQATTPRAENFARATYTTPAGATSFSTPPLPATITYYFVVRARDRAGNRDRNRVERAGVNPCV